MKPEHIKAAREAAKLSTLQAAKLVEVSQRAWQLWEAGDRKMKKGYWELFQIKVKDQK